MAKKKNTSGGKDVAKALKKAKASQKVEKKETKKSKTGKGKERVEDEQDLEEILEKMRKEWEEHHTVTEETVEGPPSKRANATLTTCPSGNYLWLIGGEVLSDEGKALFFNDVYRYAPDKHEWRRFTSPNCPGPRSAHAVATSPAGGGLIFLFGGEFSSPSQNSFHHYRDFWAFSVTNHNWERIDTKVKPSARSGCRMTMWKHYVVLFGGFHDVGIRTTYLKDLWLFDTQTYKWQEVTFLPTARQPSARSGFSFLPVPEGIILHGGYCKEYPTSSGKGKSLNIQGIGKALDDTYILLMDTDHKKIKWDKRKRVGYFPTPPRSGCTMAFWAAKSMGVLFGGVNDQEVDEERMTSVFYNDMFGYKTEGQGRWVSLVLKRGKKPKGGAGGKKKAPASGKGKEGDGDSEDDEREGTSQAPEEEVLDPDDPILSTPLVRYNAMLAVLRNTLYIYGGIYEQGSKEYTLDDFHYVALDKLDRFQCLRKPDILLPLPGAEESSSSSDDDDDEDDDDDSDDGGSEDDGEDGAEEPEEAEPAPSPVVHTRREKKKLQSLIDSAEKAGEEPPSSSDLTAASQDAAAGADTAQKTEDPMSTPLPGETLAVFYARSRDYWTRCAAGLASADSRGKELRRDGFALAEERYVEYKPTLESLERILEEAGLDSEDIKKGAAAAGGNIGMSRNRR